MKSGFDVCPWIADRSGRKNGVPLPLVCVCAVALCVSLGGLSSCASAGSVFDSVAAAGEMTDNDLLKSVGKAGSAVSKAAETITPEQEYYIGRAVAATIFESYDVYENDELTAYVNYICTSLAVNSDRPELFKGWFAAVLDTDQINAFATSGGHILITRGLISCAESEDALAAVIAHEIAHVQLQHSIKAIKTSRLSTALLATTGAALTVSGNEDLAEIADIMDESVNEIVATLVNTGYSKSQEYDADAEALAIMAAAGYDPAAMTEMLTVLEERQKHSSGGFASTHPSAKDRLNQVEKALGGYSADAGNPARSRRFHSVMEAVETARL